MNVNNAKNNISELLVLKLFWVSMPPTPLDARNTCFVSQASLATAMINSVIGYGWSGLADIFKFVSVCL